MRNNCFTLLRYVFALCIFCNHLCVCMGREIFLANGVVFVFGFFAMSGFLNFNSYRRNPDPRTFAKKRFKRIYPAYALAVVCCFLMGAALTTLPLSNFLQRAETWRYLFFNLLFLNYQQPSLPGLFEDNAMTAVNSSLWTMKVEVLFYISVPIVHWLMQRYGRNRVVLGIVVASLAYNYLTEWAFLTTGNALYNTLNHQIPGQLSVFYTPVLMLLHMEWVRRHGLLLLLTAAALLVPYCMSRDFHYLLPLAIPVLVVTFAYECRPLLFTSGWKDFSYEFYLFRFPVLQVLASLGLGLSLGLTAGLALLLIFALAIPAHYLSKALADTIH